VNPGAEEAKEEKVKVGFFNTNRVFSLLALVNQVQIREENRIAQLEKQNEKKREKDEPEEEVKERIVTICLLGCMSCIDASINPEEFSDVMNDSQSFVRALALATTS